MEESAQVNYSSFMRSLVIGGVVMFFLMAASCIWLLFSGTTDLMSVLIFGSLASGLGAFALFGTRLLPFLNCSCWVTSEGLRIVDRQARESFYPWDEISSFKYWPRLQVLDVYGKNGDRVLSVDYYVSNFDSLYSQLLESVPASA